MNINLFSNSFFLSFLGVCLSILPCVSPFTFHSPFLWSTCHSLTLAHTTSIWNLACQCATEVYNCLKILFLYRMLMLTSSWVSKDISNTFTNTTTKQTGKSRGRRKRPTTTLDTPGFSHTVTWVGVVFFDGFSGDSGLAWAAAAAVLCQEAGVRCAGCLPCLLRHSIHSTHVNLFPAGNPL